MILERQTLIRSRDLAAEIGISATTLTNWTHSDDRFKACRFRRGWYSIARLREHGILVSPSTAPAVSA